MQEKGGLFERVGAARHDDAGQRRVLGEQLVDAPREPKPLLERQLAAGDVGELLVGQTALPFEARHRLGELLGGQPAAVAIGNGPARRQHMDVRKRSASRPWPSDAESAEQPANGTGRGDAELRHCLVGRYTPRPATDSAPWRPLRAWSRKTASSRSACRAGARSARASGIRRWPALRCSRCGRRYVLRSGVSRRSSA